MMGSVGLLGVAKKMGTYETGGLGAWLFGIAIVIVLIIIWKLFDLKFPLN